MCVCVCVCVCVYCNKATRSVILIIIQEKSDKFSFVAHITWFDAGTLVRLPAFPAEGQSPRRGQV